jgi:hypothetical protein
VKDRGHWTERALGRHDRYSADPTWGHIAQCDNGDLWVPAWRNAAPAYVGPQWWNRCLNLRNPLHWAPYLRSRLARRVAAVEGDQP